MGLPNAGITNSECPWSFHKAFFPEVGVLPSFLCVHVLHVLYLKFGLEDVTKTCISLAISNKRHLYNIRPSLPATGMKLMPSSLKETGAAIVVTISLPLSVLDEVAAYSVQFHAPVTSRK
jgi:hypothetical protein